MSVESALAPKRLNFVLEYLKDFIGTKAAIRAGYAEKSANVTASRLLAEKDIQDEIKRLGAKAAGELEIDVKRVMKERGRLAFFDVRKLFDNTGKPLPIHELDDDTAAAIQGIDVCQVGNAEMGVGDVLKIKLATKDSSLTALEKTLGMYRDGSQDTPPLNIHIHM